MSLAEAIPIASWPVSKRVVNVKNQDFEPRREE
jgi:hypothetical protein